MGGLFNAVLASLVALTLTFQATPPTPPPTASVGPFTGNPQLYPLSCEIRSAVDTAAFWNIPMTEDDMIARMPHSDDPNLGFVGDYNAPAGSMPPDGYGVYALPIAQTLRRLGVDAKAHYSYTLLELKNELAQGRPVIIWSTYDMKASPLIPWTTNAGVTINVVQWEHSFVAVAYDETGISLIDAYDGQLKKFDFASFERGWAQLNNMAVTVYGRMRPPVSYTRHRLADYNHFFRHDQLDIGPF